MKGLDATRFAGVVTCAILLFGPAARAGAEKLPHDTQDNDTDHYHPAAISGIAGAPIAPARVAHRETKGFTVIYSFCTQHGCSDSARPQAVLIADVQGNFYGTASQGGSYGNGTVFKLTPTGTETVLYSFCSQANCSDGAEPYSTLVRDASGNLYGTTYLGGENNYGTVFRLAPDGTETVLYSFCSQANCVDGYYPMSGLVLSGSNLYGTTPLGGTNLNCLTAYYTGCGTVFSVTTSGAETVLYSFCGSFHESTCEDGAGPSGALLLKKGVLYGTTEYGGNINSAGTVFSLTAKGNESVIYSFCTQAGCYDGDRPNAPLERFPLGVNRDSQGDREGRVLAGDSPM